MELNGNYGKAQRSPSKNYNFSCSHEFVRPTIRRRKVIVGKEYIERKALADDFCVGPVVRTNILARLSV